MDEKRFEALFQADVEKVVAKTRRFCREFYGVDDAQFISDFVAVTAETAQLFGGYGHYSELLGFQAEILRDMAAAKTIYEKEINNAENQSL